jgi:hypothetical protein
MNTSPISTATMSTAPTRTIVDRLADPAVGSPDDLAQDIAARRRYCTWLEHWRACGTPACRRDHACTGDPTACFVRRWWHYSETARVWARAGIYALDAGTTMRSASRVADLALLDDVKRFNGLPRHRPRRNPWRHIKVEESAKAQGGRVEA